MRKWFKRSLLAFLGLAVIVILIMIATSEPIDTHPYISNTEPIVIAHRGGRGLWPENTMYAFDRAAQMGVDVLEMDVHSTKDNVIVVHHDRSIDRTTNGTGLIKDFTLNEIQTFDAGYWWTSDDGKTYPFRGMGITIPTLADVLNKFPSKRLNIELKPDDLSIVPGFVDLLKDSGRAEQILIVSFQSEMIHAVKERMPGVAVGATAGDFLLYWFLNSIWLGSAYQASTNAFQIPGSILNIDIATESFTQGAHDHNMAVHVWTINEVDKMQHYLNMNVDGIMTDYPDRLIKILGREIPNVQPPQTNTDTP